MHVNIVCVWKAGCGNRGRNSRGKIVGKIGGESQTSACIIMDSKKRQEDTES